MHIVIGKYFEVQGQSCFPQEIAMGPGAVAHCGTEEGSLQKFLDFSGLMR